MSTAPQHGFKIDEEVAGQTYDEHSTHRSAGCSGVGFSCNAAYNIGDKYTGSVHASKAWIWAPVRIEPSGEAPVPEVCGRCYTHDGGIASPSCGRLPGMGAENLAAPLVRYLEGMRCVPGGVLTHLRPESGLLLTDGWSPRDKSEAFRLTSGKLGDAKLPRQKSPTLPKAQSTGSRADEMEGFLRLLIVGLPSGPVSIRSAGPSRTYTCGS